MFWVWGLFLVAVGETYSLWEYKKDDVFGCEDVGSDVYIGSENVCLKLELLRVDDHRPQYGRGVGNSPTLTVQIPNKRHQKAT